MYFTPPLPVPPTLALRTDSNDDVRVAAGVPPTSRPGQLKRACKLSRKRAPRAPRSCEYVLRETLRAAALATRIYSTATTATKLSVSLTKAETPNCGFCVVRRRPRLQTLQTLISIASLLITRETHCSY